MKSITIHGLDDQTAGQLERISKEKGLSLNKTIKMLLHEVLGIKPRDITSNRSDFEEFSGMWTAEEAEEFSASTKSVSEVEPGEWD